MLLAKSGLWVGNEPPNEMKWGYQAYHWTTFKALQSVLMIMPLLLLHDFTHSIKCKSFCFESNISHKKLNE